MLYYEITVRCPHCLCPIPGKVLAESEPPPDAVFPLICPSHGGPIRVAFRYFKPADPFPPAPGVFHYPPSPSPPPPSATGPTRLWWQFWKWFS